VSLTEGTAGIALVIFTLTYVVLGFGALPPLRVDRTGAALIGAVAMIGFGVLTPHAAVAAIDFDTIALLFGMMVLVAHLRMAGFFGWLGTRAMARARTPRQLLVLMLWLSGAMSALFVNDTACLLLTPLALETARGVRRSPLPYLLAVAMGANIGSVATIVGNPQNMLVASFSGISYVRFAAVLAPVAVLGLAVATGILLWMFRRELAGDAEADASARAGARSSPAPVDRWLMWKATIVTGVLLVALLVGAKPSLAALLAAAALLVTRRIDPQAIYAQVDWSLLTMFAGLFVVVAGVEHAGWTERAIEAVGHGAEQSLPAFLGVVVALSNLVSNVPAVLLVKSWVAHSATPERMWLALAMASTLAGNLTLVGSVANLIVVEQARGEMKVGFWEYARVGVPLTLVTLAIGVGWLSLVTR
jgi:Na+/H+ antiporter NhaD/arsenite permease-like protein